MALLTTLPDSAAAKSGSSLHHICRAKFKALRNQALYKERKKGDTKAFFYRKDHNGSQEMPLARSKKRCRDVSGSSSSSDVTLSVSSASKGMNQLVTDPLSNVESASPVRPVQAFSMVKLLNLVYTFR